MREIKAFKCGFCPRIQQHKRNGEIHEARCSRNPHNRTCYTCKHFGGKEIYLGPPREEYWVCKEPTETCEAGWEIRGCDKWEGE